MLLRKTWDVWYIWKLDRAKNRLHNQISLRFREHQLLKKLICRLQASNEAFKATYTDEKIRGIMT